MGKDTIIDIEERRFRDRNIQLLVRFSLGPQHPATHGVLRLIPISHGEIIQFLSPEIGLLHRGSEKLIECNYYNSSIPYSDRSDYVSTVSQELLFVFTLERLINCYVTVYSSRLRTLFLEFYRVPNHCLAITTHVIDLGLFSTLLRTSEEREKIISFSEALPGTRFHAVFILLGRLRYDISLGRINALIDRLIHSTRKLKEIHNILSINPIFKDRQHEIGFIERDFSSYFGSSGVLSRSATIYPDARFIGYEFHQCIDYFRYSSSSSSTP